MKIRHEWSLEISFVKLEGSIERDKKKWFQ